MTTEILKNLSLSVWPSAKQLFSKVILRASLGENHLGLSKEDLLPQETTSSTVTVSSLLFPVEQPQRMFSKSIQKTLVNE